MHPRRARLLAVTTATLGFGALGTATAHAETPSFCQGRYVCLENGTAYKVRVQARNAASVFNYKKLGFKHVGTLHQAQCDPVSGELFDMLVFELLRADWEKQRKPAPHA